MSKVWPTRRSLVVGAAVTLGGAATVSAGKAASDSASAGLPHNTIHQERAFAATPARIYEILLDPKQFAAMTDSAAEIDSREGGAFSTFGGIIIGRNVELTPAVRIVQAWKPKYWAPGIYSLVKFELVAEGSATRIVLDQTGFPDGTYDGLNTGWPERYWDPLTKYLSATSSG